MTVLEKGHITDAALEDYALDHLVEPELEIVEEHILICPTCQDRLEEIDDFVRAFRLAHRELEASDGGGGGFPVPLGEDMPPEGHLPWRSPPWIQKPVVWACLGFAVAVVLLLAVMGAPPRPEGAPDPREAVTLVAQRGAEGGATAHAGKLALQLDLRGINSSPVVIEVSSWAGRTLWRQRIDQAAESERVHPGVEFAAGQYWVRVRAKGDQTLLREFGLRVAAK